MFIRGLEWQTLEHCRITCYCSETLFQLISSSSVNYLLRWPKDLTSNFFLLFYFLLLTLFDNHHRRFPQNPITMSDEDYLQEGFDPRSVTVPRLRSILVTHNVGFGNAKKPQLVALVEEHVLPLAPRLRDQRARAKRSSMGIVNAGSAEDNGNWADDLAPPTASKRRSKSPRKSSTRVKSEEIDDAPSLRSPAKRASRSVSRVLSHADETPDYEAPKSTRRNRRTITPQIKDESEDEYPPLEEESVFTDDNPFQSGSSPPQAKSSNRRRSSNAGRTSRRVTEEYDQPKQLRVPRVRGQATPVEDIQPGEEFTPDEQLELEEATHKGEVILPARDTGGKSRRRFNLTTPLLVLFFTLLGSYGFWYRQEKIVVGYCGLSQRPVKELLPPDFPTPDFLIPFIEPQCEQCPAHAYCYENFEARCEPDFVLQQHPLSLGGLVPLPPSCEPDSEKARRVQAVADKAVEELRERRAKFECGELTDKEGKLPDSPAIPESELKETVSRKRSKRLNSAEFEELWAVAIGEVTSRDEVEVETAK